MRRVRNPKPAHFVNRQPRAPRSNLPIYEILELSKTWGRNGEAREVSRFFVKTKLVFSLNSGG